MFETTEMENMVPIISSMMSRVWCLSVPEEARQRLKETLKRWEVSPTVAESNCEFPSPDSVVYHSPPGADVQKLRRLAQHEGGGQGTSIMVDRPTRRNEVRVEVHREGGLTKEDLENLVKLIKADLSNPVRQYSYSFVSGNDARDEDAFGSILHRFFQDSAFQFVDSAFPGSQLSAPAMEAPEGRFLKPAEGLANGRGSRGGAEQISKELQSLGCVVTLPDENGGASEGDPWESLAGYAELKNEIQDSVVAPLMFPQAFKELQSRTRSLTSPAVPRVMLFTGQPGTGKTSSARIIAKATKQPFVYLPIEAVASKWYGESEGTLSKIFQLADALAKTYATDGDVRPRCLVFIDEVETLAGSRDSEMHEVSRKLLSVLLKTIDGFKESEITLIAATNRRADLDAAFLSRCDVILNFPVPDAKTRKLIWAKYAKHLNEDDVAKLAKNSAGFSGRNIRDTAAQVERSWVAAWARRGSKDELGTPTLTEYLDVLGRKREDVNANGKPLRDLFL
jgi:hypothetical protein